MIPHEKLMMGEIVLVISGASGAAYGVRLAHVLGHEARLVVTESGRITMAVSYTHLTLPTNREV